MNAPSRAPSVQPTKDVLDFLTSVLGGDEVRLISLDTRNPHGGRGGSLDSDQCAWLVRELAKDSDRGVILSTRHRSRELRNTRTLQGALPRILADELVPLLLGHPNVLGWIGGHRHYPSAIRHGVRDSGLWEVTPSLLGFGGKAWLAFQRRRAVPANPERLLVIPTLMMTPV